MKAMVLTQRYGGVEALELAEVEAPAPRPGHVLVRVRAASVNDWDWGLVQDDAPWFDQFFGRIVTRDVKVPGCDIAGVVEAVADGVTAFKPGDEVYGDLCASGFGAFAEYARAPAHALARKPPGMSFEEAAAIPQAGMLAVQGLIDAGCMQAGCRLLVNGAGGGVGTFAIQIAKERDAHVTAVDKRFKLEMLRGLGADRVIDYERQDCTVGDALYDLILDAKMTRSPMAFMKVLKPGGIYVTVGGNIGRLLQTAALGPFIARRDDGRRARLVQLKPNKDLAFMNELFERGRMRPVIEGPFPIEGLPHAFRLFGTGNHQGKIVVTMA